MPQASIECLNTAESCAVDAREAIDGDDPRKAARHVRDGMANLQYAFNKVADDEDIEEMRPEFYKARIAIDRCKSLNTLDAWIGREAELCAHLRAVALNQEKLDTEGVRRLLYLSHTAPEEGDDASSE